MDELTGEQIEELRRELQDKRQDLERLLEITRDGVRPVAVDESIGRLTRMDAIQQQKVAAATRRGHEVRYQQVLRALAALEKEEYGSCQRCEDPIGYARLKARPEAPLCVECQDGIDRR